MSESFEISKEQEATLCEMAEREGVSVSELITRLLHFGEEAKRAGEVRLDSKTLAGILSCANDEDLADAGRKFGETLPVSYLRSLNRPCDFESCYYLLTGLLGEHNNWYDFIVEDKPEITKFTLKDSNKLGKKWLRFVGEYAAAMVRSILKIDPKMSIAEDQVLLEIKKTKNSS